MTPPKAKTDTSGPAPEQPKDPRAAALAELAANNDVAYADTPLTDPERAAAAEAGISLAGGADVDPAAVRKAIAEAGTGTPAESVQARGDTRNVDDYDPAKPPAEPEKPADPLPADRDTALEALLGSAGIDTTRRAVQLTGNVVDLGGDVERVVIVRAYGATMPAKDGIPAYAKHGREGDVVLVTKAEAERGAKLKALMPLPKGKATLEVSERPGVAGTVDEGILTGEALTKLNAKDTLGYLSRHPDQAETILEAELARDVKQQRKTVLEALAASDR